MRIVACSPLTKIFLPEWEERLLADPELIFDEKEPFSFTVPRSVGSVENVRFGVPFRADDYLRKSPNERDAKAGADLAYYLTGGDDASGMQETDWTGIVMLPSSTYESSVAEIHHMVLQAQMSGEPARIKRAEEQMMLLSKKSFEETQSAMSGARELADKRVIRQLKTTHYNLMQQYKHNKEDGKGLYAPSIPEHFGAFVLRKIVQVSEGRRKMNSDFNKLINEVWIQ